MNIKDPRHDLPIWNSGCAALMCVAYAALLVEACAIRLGAGPRPQLACIAAFLVQAAAIHHSIRPFRAGAGRGLGADGAQWLGLQWRGDRAAGIASALLLAALGFAGAAWLETGWALAAAMFAVALCAVPWSRIPLCRRRLPWACAILLLGGAAALSIGMPLSSPLLLLVPAWVMWLAAGCAWLRVILLKRRKARVLAGYPASG